MDWDGYATALAQREGGYDLRRAPAPVRGWLRSGYEVARGLQAIRVPPAAVTVAGLLLAVLVPAFAGRGPTGLVLAAGLVLLGCLTEAAARALDLLAPPGRGSARTAIWQAAARWLAEVAWLVGFWAAGAPGPLVAACGALTGLHELVRGQALAAGASRLGAQTVAERPMRVTVAATGLALAGIAAAARESFGAGVLTVAAVGWLLLAVLGSGQLMVVVHRSLR